MVFVFQTMAMRSIKGIFSRIVRGVTVRVHRILKNLFRLKSFRSGYLWFGAILVKLKILSKERELLIVSPKSGLFAANWLKDQIGQIPFKSRIVDKIQFRDLFKPAVVIAPQKFFWLPLSYIAFQVEQLPQVRHWTKVMQKSLTYSSHIFEYSTANLPILDLYIPREKVDMVQVTPLKEQQNRWKNFEDRTIEVLFYGSMESRRRQEAINYLSQYFRIEVVTATYGKDLNSLIQSSKCVINIHFWENSLFESIRISEVLSQSTPVISEEGLGQDEYPYTNLVSINRLGDWQSMAVEISRLIHNRATWIRRYSQIRKQLDGPQSNNKYMLRRVKNLLEEVVGK